MDISALQGMLGGGAGGVNLNMGRGGATAAAAAAAGAGGSRSTPSPADLKTHADHMWRFLDDLATSDPEGYKKFISGQMEQMAAEKAKQEETEALFTPQPAFAFATQQTSGKGAPRTLFINVCSSAQVPGLQTKDRKPAKGTEPLSDVLIPLSVGAIKSDTDASHGGSVFTSDVVFNPAVIARAQGGDMGFKLFLLELALQHLEEDEKVTLHRGYKLLPTSSAYVGGVNGKPATQHRTESEISRADFVAKMQAERAEKIKQMATKPAGEVVMPSRARTAQAQKEYEESEGIKELKLRPDAATPAASSKEGATGAAAPQKKRVLIEDLTPGQSEDESLRRTEGDSAAAAQANAAAKSTAAKPAIALASTTKKSSAASAASSSAAASSTAAVSSSVAAASPAPSSSSSSSTGAVSVDASYSSRASTALSSDELLTSLAAMPVEESGSSWPYGAPPGASGKSTEKVTPSHTVNVADGALDVCIQLPLVTSVSEVELDVSRTQLRLESAHYSLTLTFPAPIDDASSAAKFVKKQRTLKIHANMLAQ